MEYKQKKERKSNLLTIRLTDEETSALDYISEQTGKNKSDVIARACKYFVSVGDDYVNEDLGGSRGGDRSGSGTDGKRKLSVRVHARLSDSDMDRIREHGLQSGDTVSQIVRKAITAFASVTGIGY